MLKDSRSVCFGLRSRRGRGAPPCVSPKPPILCIGIPLVGQLSPASSAGPRRVGCLLWWEQLAQRIPICSYPRWIPSRRTALPRSSRRRMRPPKRMPPPRPKARLLEAAATDVGADAVSGEAGDVTSTCGARFEPLVAYERPAALHGVAVGDFDGDGHLDFVTASGWENESRIELFRSDAHGQFADPTVLDTRSNAPCMRWCLRTSTATAAPTLRSNSATTAGARASSKSGGGSRTVR